MNSTAAQKLFDELSHDLPNVDKEKALKYLQELSLYDAARNMGFLTIHYDNLKFAGRLIIYHAKLSAPKDLFSYLTLMKEFLNPGVYYFMLQHLEVLQTYLDKYSYQDYDFDWFSGNSMLTIYAAKIVNNGPPVETPQIIWLRIAVQFYHRHKNALERTIQAFQELSEGWYTPASPTFFTAGFQRPQMASCFLLRLEDDMESILEQGFYRAGMISKNLGGLGISLSLIRHSEIRGGGFSGGILPLLLAYDNFNRMISQGTKRKGGMSCFLRIHHIDVEDFIDVTKRVGDRYSRAYDINTCLWTSWIFWERVQEDGDWSLFCPKKTPMLNNVYGKEFTELYLQAERDPKHFSHKKVVKARELLNRIINVQRESGMPYLMNGDAANIKSNHRHLGPIHGSNLCLEIIEYTDKDTIASCNLHSLSLRRFAVHPLSRDNKNLVSCFDFAKFGRMVHKIVDNLNQMIDHNYYPLDKVKDGKIVPKIIHKSNLKHRPLGIGVSGFAEMLHILNLPIEDERVRLLNKMIFACMYWNALAQSVQLAVWHGTYESFVGSPASQGKLQFDLWREEFQLLGPNKMRKYEDDDPLAPDTWCQEIFLLYDQQENIIDRILPSWEDLKRVILKYGLRNSLLTALMPTATTAQVRNNCESVELHQNNLYSRKVLKNNYAVLNRYLQWDLEKIHLWNEHTLNFLLLNDGSIQDFPNFVEQKKNYYPLFHQDQKQLQEELLFIKEKYKTMWEVPQRLFMVLAAERGRYIDQSASSNLFFKECTDDKLLAAHITSNLLGLKTNMYYLRQKGGQITKFTADFEKETKSDTTTQKYEIQLAPDSQKSLTDLDICISCT